MKQEDKELLLKDLCARLPYHPLIKTPSGDRNLYGLNEHNYEATFGAKGPVELIKPYLRPLSSMTEEERDELYTAMDWYGEIDETGNVYTKGQEKVYRETFYEYTDWLYAHHFDYRGLIEKGLALEAPKDMYKTE